MTILPSHIAWPEHVLEPSSLRANVVPFSRSGGRTLSGKKKTTRTDRGYWMIALGGIHLGTPQERRAWQAIRTTLSGTSGLIVVPAWSFDSAPYASGEFEAHACVSFSDGTSFDDGTLFEVNSMTIELAEDMPLGATQCKLRVIDAQRDLSGVRFSHDHALYETGQILDEDGDVFTVSLATACRKAIPADTELEFDRPTCLCHLADDRGMDLALSHHANDIVAAQFAEAVDFWSDLAAGLL